MLESTLENGQLEPQLNSDLQPIDNSSSPNIAKPIVGCSASLSTEKDKKVSEIINDLTPITSQLNDLIKKHNLSTTDLVFNQSTDGIRFFIDYDNITRVLCRYKMPTVDVLLYGFELIEKQENSLTYRKDIGHNCFLELEVNFNIFSLYFNTHIGDSRLCQFYRFTINTKEEFEFILKKSMTSYAFDNLL